MMIDKSQWTQDDVDDGEITPFREGFLSYMFGWHLQQNPYKAYGDNDIDDKRYYDWYDGWKSAAEHYPHIEPEEE
jgi:hypothetical protein